jgi:hypothetical protein
MRQLLIVDQQTEGFLFHISCVKAGCADFSIRLLDEDAIVEVPRISLQGNTHHALWLRHAGGLLGPGSAAVLFFDAVQPRVTFG